MGSGPDRRRLSDIAPNTQKLSLLYCWNDTPLNAAKPRTVGRHSMASSNTAQRLKSLYRLSFEMEDVQLSKKLELQRVPCLADDARKRPMRRVGEGVHRKNPSTTTGVDEAHPRRRCLLMP